MSGWDDSVMCDEAVAALPVLYWLAALLLLYARAHSETFGRLTQYGGRSITTSSPDTGAVQGHKTSQQTTLLETLVQDGVRVLHRCRLDRRCISRKVAFCAFYLSGLVTCAVLYTVRIIYSSATNDGGGRVMRLPLLAFALHCLVRLTECVLLHRFRRTGDHVTVFALLAGCSFYVIAALSSCSCCCCHCRLHRPSRPGRLVACVLFALHLVLQAVQVAHHHVLARLRGRPARQVHSTPSVSVKASKGTTGAVDARDDDARVQGYHFPSHTLLFRYVLEPHYMCEVLMHGVNALSVVCGVWLHWSHGRRSASSARLAVWQVGAALGLWLFTLCNLSLTAREHRVFWDYVNARRHRMGNAAAAEVLPRYTVLPLVS